MELNENKRWIVQNTMEFYLLSKKILVFYKPFKLFLQINDINI
jgi:hypothetical protein